MRHRGRANSSSAPCDGPRWPCGQPLRTLCLEPKLFMAAAMQVVAKDLMAMKVTELKEELAARDEAVSGNKAWLRRRLHAAIVREYVDGAMEDEGE